MPIFIVNKQNGTTKRVPESALDKLFKNGKDEWSDPIWAPADEASEAFLRKKGYVV